MDGWSRCFYLLQLIHPSIGPSIHRSIHLSIHASIGPSIYPSICPCGHCKHPLYQYTYSFNHIHPYNMQTNGSDRTILYFFSIVPPPIEGYGFFYYISLASGHFQFLRRLSRFLVLRPTLRLKPPMLSERHCHRAPLTQTTPRQ